MTKNINEQIEDVKKRLKALNAKKQKMQAAERHKTREQKRKEDTRRKILLGAFYLQRMESNEIDKEKILKSLDGFLTENRDRVLFGLPPLGDASNAKTEEKTDP